MSTYVMSDLHGCKEEFDAMLRIIEFSEYDELYIIGDVADRGRKPIPLYLDILAHPNMHLIMGNHDAWLLKYCDALIEEKRNPGSLYRSQDFLIWIIRNGGFITVDQYLDLPFPSCYDIKTYLEEVPLYQYLTIKGKKYLLVHAGLNNQYNRNTNIATVSEDVLLWSHIDLEDNPYPDVTMIVGHTPTFLYGDEFANKIAKGLGNPIYHIDCGCVFGYSLGCLRLDDMQEFYIKSTYPKTIE